MANIPYRPGDTAYFENDDRLIFTKGKRKGEMVYFERYVTAKTVEVIPWDKTDREIVSIYNLRYYAPFDPNTVKIERLARSITLQLEKTKYGALTEVQCRAAVERAIKYEYHPLD
jgi:hypothetical protein